MIIEIVMSILFNWCVFSSSGSDHFNIRKIASRFSQRCLFHSSQIVFIFPPSHPFFFKDSDFLIKYPFMDVKSLHSFQSMFLHGGSLEDALLVHHSSFFSSPVDSIQAFCVDHMPFPCFKYLLIPVHLIIIHF